MSQLSYIMQCLYYSISDQLASTYNMMPTTQHRQVTHKYSIHIVSR